MDKIWHYTSRLREYEIEDDGGIRALQYHGYPDYPVSFTYNPASFLPIFTRTPYSGGEELPVEALMGDGKGVRLTTCRRRAQEDDTRFLGLLYEFSLEDIQKRYPTLKIEYTPEFFINREDVLRHILRDEYHRGLEDWRHSKDTESYRVIRKMIEEYQKECEIAVYVPEGEMVPLDLCLNTYYVYTII